MTIIFCYFFYKTNKKIWEILLLFLAVLCLIISIFSPRIGEYNKDIAAKWGNILFITDLSTSMKVEDIEWKNWNITRLDFVKNIITNFVDSQQNNKYWLYWFAWDSLEILPFTTDLWLFKTILNGIDEKNISVKWSNFTQLFSWLETYISRLDWAATFVIFSDAGEIENLKISSNLQKKLDEKSIKILFVAVWTSQWGRILDWVDFYGRPTFKMYNGQEVISKVEKNKVKNIAEEYNFSTLFSDSYRDYDRLFKNINSQLMQSEIEINISQARDISYIFVLIFLLFFTTFLFLEKRKT